VSRKPKPERNGDESRQEWGAIDDAADRHQEARTRGSMGIIDFLPTSVKSCHLQEVEMSGYKPK
jgi:hypothetical protein